MNPRKSIDFKRGIKALATENGWLVEISDQKGPTERIVIYSKEGNEVARIASIILRKDEKEIDPSIARALLRKLKNRVEQELVDEAGKQIGDSIDILIAWIKSLFS